MEPNESNGREPFPGRSHQGVIDAVRQVALLGFVGAGVAIGGAACWILVAAGIAIWVALPWTPHPKGGVWYGRFAGSIGPTIVGWLVGVGPMVLPALIARENDWSLLGEGLPLLCIFWPIGLLGSVCLVVAVSRGTFLAVPGKDGVWWGTMRGHEWIPYGNIALASYGVSPTSRVVSRIARVILLFRPLTPGLIAGAREENMVVLQLKDGSARNLWLSELHGLEGLLRALHGAQVPFDAEMQDLYRLQTEE